MARTIMISMAFLGAVGVGTACVVSGDEPGVAESQNGAAKVDIDSQWSHEPGCSFRETRGTYGYQCSGSQLLPSSPPSLVPVTIVGTLVGDGTGGFAGSATLSSPLGSLRQRLSGRGALDGCIGRITYDVNQIEFPPGSGNWVSLPPVIADGAIVDGGREILVALVAPGAQGDAVPRLTCRLVRTRRDD